LIADGRAYLFGAFGTLTCVALDDGKVVWRRELQREFPATEKLPWGLASSPSLVDGRLVVQTSGRAATLLALDPTTGKTLWQSAGDGPAFASFITATFGGKKQLIGYDRTSLGGWDAATGERLWKLKPPQSDDFNVPTPIVVGDALIVASENNGTRRYRFDGAGKIMAKPEAEHFDLAPDTHTPVLADGKLFGIWGRLFCLSASDLKELYTADDDAFNDYTSLIASDERVLVLTEAGELLLLDATADRLRVLGKLKLFDGATGIFAHPALVGDRMYVRSNDEIVCLSLSMLLERGGK
jgi:outer membrane protein assembly factor BamB